MQQAHLSSPSFLISSRRSAWRRQVVYYYSLYAYATSRRLFASSTSSSEGPVHLTPLSGAPVNTRTAASDSASGSSNGAIAPTLPHSNVTRPTYRASASPASSFSPGFRHAQRNHGGPLQHRDRFLAASVAHDSCRVLTTYPAPHAPRYVPRSESPDASGLLRAPKSAVPLHRAPAAGPL